MGNGPAKGYQNERKHMMQRTETVTYRDSWNVLGEQEQKQVWDLFFPHLQPKKRKRRGFCRPDTLGEPLLMAYIKAKISGSLAL